MSKGKSLIKMIRRAVKHGITANYLLTDSWFLSEDMIYNIRKIKGGIIHIISMCKMDKRKYNVGNKYSSKYDKFYVGHTPDPQKRLWEHNSYDTGNKYTAKYQPWELAAFFPISEDRGKAMKTERVT